MPVVPVLPGFAGLDGWSLWKQGRITAANVTWSADATDPNAQQNFLLSPIAIEKGYNAIRLVLSAGSSDSAWDDMYKIALYGWGKTIVSGPSDNAAIAAAPRLAAGNQPIGDVVYIDSNGAQQVIEAGLATQIDAILNKCATLGMGVILDCHDFFQRNQSNGAVGPLWVGNWTRPSPNSSTTLSASQIRDALVTFWTKTVTRFPSSTYPAIIGYEILNEPNPDPSLTFAQMEDGRSDNCWSKLATRCIKAIRALDANTPIVVDGIYYADAYGLKYFDPTLNGAGLLPDFELGGVTPKSVANRRLVYSFHVYGPYEYTHQGISEGTYESQGIPYPLDAALPYSGGAAISNARIRSTVQDGSSAWVGDTTHNPSASTARTLDLKYLSGISAATMVTRNQPAVDFKTRAAAAQGGVAVPIFLGEFSAVDTKLIQPDHIPTTSTRRVVTKIEVDSEGLATVTLGQLSGGFSITLFPQYDAAGSTAPGYNGAYNDFAKAALTVTDSANSAFNITSGLGVRIENGNNKIVPPFRASGPNPGATLNDRKLLALYYTSSSMYGQTLGDGSTQVATLTISMGDYSYLIYLNERVYQGSRYNYIKDVLTMCLAQGFSWAYWQEDGYTTTATNINDLVGKDVFIGWRPSALMSATLTLAASRRTLLS